MKRPGNTKKTPVPRPAAESGIAAAAFTEKRTGWLLALIGFLLYANTLSFNFTLDDYSVIIENRITRQGWSAIPTIFKTSYRAGYYFTDDDLYRPIPKAMYAAEWGMFGQNATPGHLINVLLFALTGFVLFRFLFRFTRGNKWLSVFTVLLFLAHPIHTEVVASIKSRDEILALLFSLLSLHAYLYSKSNFGKWGGAGGFLFLALLSKESAITMLAIYPLAKWFSAESPIKKILAGFGSVLTAALLFLLIRHSIIGSISPGPQSVADNLLMAAHNPMERFATAVVILGMYFKLLLFPHPLAFDYSFNQIPIANFADWRFLVSLTLYGMLLVGGFLLIKKKKMAGFAIGWYLLTLSIFSNIFIIIGSSMGERFLYMPSLGFCLLAAVVFDSAFRRSGATGAEPKLNLAYKTSGVALAALILVGCSAKTISRNPVWKNNGTLYAHDVHNSPNSTRTHYYLGNYLIKPEAAEGKSDSEKKALLEEGIEQLRQSVKIYNGFSDAHLQMGVAYDRLNQPDSAMACYQRALAINPTQASIHNNIGTIYFKTGKYTEALTTFLKAVELDKQYSEAYCNAGSAYGMMQQYDNALNMLFEAVKHDPGNAQAYYYIGITYNLKGDTANGASWLAKAKALDPKLQ